jgi:regulator of replication initiation timing
MSNANIKIVTVPRDIYYHEVAYVRGLETAVAELRAENGKLYAENERLKRELERANDPTWGPHL